jgi:uncharacterized protein YifE (UPF0438 family)
LSELAYLGKADYLGGSSAMRFVIRTTKAIFDSHEFEILSRYGMQFERLMKGQRAPTTPAQERFIRMCKNEVDPESEYEKVWWKYLRRLEWERNPINQSALGSRRKAGEGFGGSRQQYKEMRKADRADFWKRLRE